MMGYPTCERGIELVFEPPDDDGPGELVGIGWRKVEEVNWSYCRSDSHYRWVLVGEVDGQPCYRLLRIRG